jgi:replication fork clamp-binding protein CrfC
MVIYPYNVVTGRTAMVRKNFTSPEALRIQQKFLEKVKPLLEAQDISYGEVGRRLGLSTPTISRYFSLDRAMDIDVYIALSRIVGKPLTELINEKSQ